MNGRVCNLSFNMAPFKFKEINLYNVCVSKIVSVNINHFLIILFRQNTLYQYKASILLHIEGHWNNPLFWLLLAGL